MEGIISVGLRRLAAEMNLGSCVWKQKLGILIIEEVVRLLGLKPNEFVLAFVGPRKNPWIRASPRGAMTPSQEFTGENRAHPTK